MIAIFPIISEVTSRGYAAFSNHLKHDDKREQIARNGYALYKEKFTWKKRAKELLTLF